MSATSPSPQACHKLSPHLIRKIIDFLWIRDKFRVMCVNREWFAAACKSIHDHRRLVLSVTSDCFDEDVEPVLDPDEIRESYCEAVFSGMQMMGIKRREEPVGLWKSLARMTQLHCLVIDRGKHEEHLTVIPVIRRNSLHLKYLNFPNFGPLRDVFFPQLETLICGDLFDAQIQSAPFLKDLTCKEVSRHVLQRLPHDLLSLAACLKSFPPPDMPKIWLITRFKQLNKLSLTLPFIVIPEQFFSSFNLLTSVHICFIVGRRESQDLPLMDQSFLPLIRCNERLEEIAFRGVVLSDQWMWDASQLPVLTRIRVTECPNSQITTSGVVALIRGRSRHAMQELLLMTSHDLDVEYVRQELDLLRKDRGFKLRARITSPHF